jgi:HEAT repeat protein
MNDLIRQAVAEEYAEMEVPDDGHDWFAAETMARSAEALLLAAQLASSDALVERAIAAHVLHEFVNGNGNESQVRAAVALLTSMLEREHEPNLHVEWSIIDALAMAWDHSALEPLMTRSASRSANIRRRVAQGIGAAIVEECDPAGVHTLIHLTEDTDASVRDWATFELAGVDADSPEIRAALWARIADPHYDTRCEALLGLATRHEHAIMEHVVKELKADSVGKLAVEAAKELAQPALLAPLLDLQDWWDVDPDLLQQAIQACAAGKPSDARE